MNKEEKKTIRQMLEKATDQSKRLIIRALSPQEMASVIYGEDLVEVTRLMEELSKKASPKTLKLVNSMFKKVFDNRDMQLSNSLSKKQVPTRRRIKPHGKKWFFKRKKTGGHDFHRKLAWKVAQPGMDCISEEGVGRVKRRLSSGDYIFGPSRKRPRLLVLEEDERRGVKRRRDGSFVGDEYFEARERPTGSFVGDAGCRKRRRLANRGVKRGINGSFVGDGYLVGRERPDGGFIGDGYFGCRKRRRLAKRGAKRGVGGSFVGDGYFVSRKRLRVVSEDPLVEYPVVEDEVVEYQVVEDPVVEEVVEYPVVEDQVVEDEVDSAVFESSMEEPMMEANDDDLGSYYTSDGIRCSQRVRIREGRALGSFYNGNLRRSRRIANQQVC